MLQPWRRVERRKRKISSLRPRTVDSLVLSHFFSHHFLAISGPFLVETFWNLYGLYVWLASNRCFVHFCSPFAPSFRADSRNCRMIHQTMLFSLYRCQMKVDRVKNMVKRRRPKKEGTESWIFSEWLTLSLYWFMGFTILTKKMIWDAMGVIALNPPRIGGLLNTSEHSFFRGPSGNVCSFHLFPNEVMVPKIEELRLTQFLMCCLDLSVGIERHKYMFLICFRPISIFIQT